MTWKKIRENATSFSSSHARTTLSWIDNVAFVCSLCICMSFFCFSIIYFLFLHLFFPIIIVLSFSCISVFQDVLGLRTAPFNDILWLSRKTLTSSKPFALARAHFSARVCLCSSSIQNGKMQFQFCVCIGLLLDSNMFSCMFIFYDQIFA